MAAFFFHLKINEKALPFQKVSDTRLQRNEFRERKKNSLFIGDLSTFPPVCFVSSSSDVFDLDSYYDYNY